MSLDLEKIDHVHVFVRNRPEAEEWYSRVLGFHRVKALESWATPGGPLTLENGDAHLALFESDRGPASTVAFRVPGEKFLQWKRHLEDRELGPRLADHDLAWSLYFHDPDGNPYEITTYDRDIAL